MKRLFSAVLILALLVGLFPANFLSAVFAAEQAQDHDMVVGSMNYGLWENGLTPEGVPAAKVDSTAAAWKKMLQENEIDLICGQEWVPYLDEDKTVDANEKIFSQDYPYQYSYGTSTYDGKHIASKTELTDAQIISHTSGSGRKYAKAYTTVNGKTVCIMNTHLSFEEDITVSRLHQIQELLAAAKQEEYVIITGDFNVYTPDEFQLFADAGYSLANCGAFGEFTTWPNFGKNPTSTANRCLDNIIVSPSIQIQDAYVEDRELSDHALVVAKLKLLDAGEYTDTRDYCRHCDKEVTWQAWTQDLGSSSNPVNADAHYYLTQDLTGVSSNLRFGNNSDITKPDVVIDLRGHTISSSSVRIFYLRQYAKLSIVDSVGGGEVIGGTTATGGAVYLEKYAEFTLYGGAVSSTDTTTAKKGGTIYAEGSTHVQIKGGVLYGGYASTGGAILLGGSNSKATVSNSGIIIGGTATHGGAIYAAGSNTVNIDGGIIYGSQVNTAGGAIYAYNSTLNVTGGTITGGTAVNGGNIYAASTKTTLSGGKLMGGHATSYGGNIHVGDVGSAGYTNLGNCILTGGTSGYGGKDIYVSSAGKLNVLKTFAGTSSMATSSSLIPSPVAAGSYMSTSAYSCEGFFPGQLYLENLTGKPRLYGKQGDTKLYIEGAVLVKEDGSKVWYANNKAAVTAYATEENVAYLQPFADELALTGGSYTVDLAGQDVAITGTGSVTCFDSANADYLSFGDVTLSGAALVNTASFAAPDGETYYTVKGADGTYSFHILDMNVSAIGLKTSSNGMYYYANYRCDDTLKGAITSYGIDYALYDAAGTTKIVDKEQSVAISNSDVPLVTFEDIAIGSMNGVISNDNAPYTAAECGRMKIEAIPFVNINGEKVTGTAVKYSMYDCCQAVDEMITELLTADAQDATAASYIEYMTNLFDVVWAEYGLGWNFTNFNKAA